MSDGAELAARNPRGLDAVNACRALLVSINDPDARRSLALSLRLDRLHALQDPEEAEAFPHAYGGGVARVESDTDVSEEDDAAPPKARASLLDSLGISGRADDAALTLGLESDPYLREIEWYSAPHRAAKALRHAKSMKAASVVARETMSEGHLPVTLVRYNFESKWRWHKGRAKGALERFSRVESCGHDRVSSFCSGCGKSHDTPSRCGTNRVCLACRNAARKKRHARFSSAQSRVLTHAKRVGLLRRNRAGGDWREKMITLTVPHVGTGEDDAVHERIRLLFTAWREFARHLKTWVKRRDTTGALAWYRAFEWTDGKGHDGRGDGLGHPHFHLWIFGPYLPKPLVAGWWTQALLAAGLDPAELYAPELAWAGSGDQAGEWCEEAPRAHELAVSPAVAGRCSRIKGIKRERRPARCGLDRAAFVDVRAGNGGVGAEVTKGTIRVLGADGQAVARYIEGWSLLDVSATGERVPAVIIARVYEALDGRRLVSTSRRLLDRDREGCSGCGAVRTVRVEVYDPVIRAATCRRPKRARPPPPE